LGEFNLSSQHVLIGGVDESEKAEVGSVTTREAAIARPTTSVASRGAVAVLAGDRSRVFQRRRSGDRRGVAAGGQQMV
jgi:hypothetical protein